MDNNWQQISLLEAKYMTQCGKFRSETDVDPFAMEEQRFILKENEKVRFKFKLVMSDPVKYYTKRFLQERVKATYRRLRLSTTFWRCSW